MSRRRREVGEVVWLVAAYLSPLPALLPLLAHDCP